MSRSDLRSLLRPWPILFTVGLLVMFAWVATRGPLGIRQIDDEPNPTVSLRTATDGALEEARLVVTRLHHDAWVRELAPTVVAEHRAGVRPSMGWPDGMTPRVAERDSIGSALAHPYQTPVTSHDVAIGLHLVEVDLPRSLLPREVAILGLNDGTSFCLRVVPTAAGPTTSDPFVRAARLWHTDPDRARVLREFGRTDLLGACALVHRFGVPGDHIRAWLGARASALRDLEGLARFSWQQDDGGQHDELNVGAILTGQFLEDGVHVTQRACRDGNRDACMREFFPDGRPSGAAGGATVVEGDQFMFVTGLAGSLTGRLEREFGETAFERFWTSDLPVDVAFESAFGVHPADWVRGHATEFRGTLRAGPAPGAGPLATSLLLMLLGLAVGTLSALRRTTG